jgi:hypothetical protein
MLYYTWIKAVDKAGGIATNRSDGYVADVTGPTFEYLIDLSHDGRRKGVDIDYAFAHNTSMHARWACNDVQSKLLNFEWGIGSRPLLNDVMNMTPWATSLSKSNIKLPREYQGKERIALQMEANATGLNLSTGIYFVNIKATNRAGLSTIKASDGILIDTTAPGEGSIGIHEGNLSSKQGRVFPITYQSNTTTIEATWTQFYDQYSGLRQYEWAIGTSAFGIDIQNYTKVGVETKGQSHNLQLSTNGRYFVSVRATNFVSLSTASTSACVIVDATNPTSTPVFDGKKLGIDVNLTSSRMVWARWGAFSDGESHILTYELAWATYPSASNIRIFKLIAGATTGSATLPLRSGQRYYSVVRGTNGAGLSSLSSSTGFLFDVTPPVRKSRSAFMCTSVIKHSMKYNFDRAMSIAINSLTKQLSAQWNNLDDARYSDFEDVESGIAYYEFSTPYSTNSSKYIDVYSTWFGYHQFQRIANKTALGLSTNISSFPIGARVAIVLRVWNNAGLYTEAQTPSIVVEGSAVNNLNAIVYVGAKGTSPLYNISKQRFQAITTAVVASWKGFVDTDSGITEYKWRIGSTAGGSDLQNLTTVRLNTSAINSAVINLVHLQSFWVTVVAFNRVGLSSFVTSEKVTIDLTVPVAGWVRDGASGADISYQSSTSVVSANWGGFSDAESGIAEYWASASWRLRNDTGKVLALISLGTSTSMQRSIPVCKQHLVSYSWRHLSVAVSASNAAGLKTVAVSNGVTVDVTPPVYPPGALVLDTTGISNTACKSDIDVQGSNNFAACWKNFTDGESGVVEYYVSITTNSTPPASHLPVWYSAGLDQSLAVKRGDTLQGHHYYQHVMAVNGAGMGTIVSSNGSIVDLTPPYAPPYAVRDGKEAWEKGQDINCQASNSSIAATWSRFTDLESAIVTYEWGVGSSRGATDVQAYMLHTSKTLTSSNANVRLMRGHKYFVSVRATNKAGKSQTAVSDGVLVLDDSYASSSSRVLPRCLSSTHQSIDSY